MLPKTIKIGAHHYRIKTATRKEMGKENSADVGFETNTIRVITPAARSRLIELIIHESLHAMVAGHDFADEEAMILILGNGITSLIADNPEFIREAIKTLSDPKKS